VQNEFPVIQGLLREFVEDDITAGFKELLSTLRGGWTTSSAEEMEKKHKRAMKDLSPEQQQAIIGMLTSIKNQLVTQPDAFFNVGDVTNHINTKQEAIAMVTGLLTMGEALGDLDKRFVNNSRASLSEAEFEQFKDQAASRGSGGEMPYKKDFVAEHSELFKQHFAFGELGLLDRDRISTWLRSMLQQTPEKGEAGRTRRDAAIAMHYYLHRLRITMHRFFKEFEQELLSRNLSDTSKERTFQKSTQQGQQLLKSLGKRTAPRPAPKPGAAPSVQPTKSKEAIDAVAAFKQLGVDQGEAQQLVSDALAALGADATADQIVNWGTRKIKRTP